jgi:hypothetical protein
VPPEQAAFFYALDCQGVPPEQAAFFMYAASRFTAVVGGSFSVPQN